MQHSTSTKTLTSKVNGIKSSLTHDSLADSTLYYRECASQGKSPSISAVIAKAQPSELTYQKWWLFWHSLILFIVSAICIPMLYLKQTQIDQFYQHQSQCCYCLWVGNNGTISNNYKIEWSPCALHLDQEIPLDLNSQHDDQDQFHIANANDVCNINGIYTFIFPFYKP